jgi:hypothetical protein
MRLRHGQRQLARDVYFRRRDAFDVHLEDLVLLTVHRSGRPLTLRLPS